MARTRPTGDQLRFNSEANGEFVLDTYLENCEKGGRTLPDLLDEFFDVDGLLTDFIEMREDPLAPGSLQYRLGTYVNLESGWITFTTTDLNAFVTASEIAQAAAEAAQAAAQAAETNSQIAETNSQTAETNAAASAAAALASAQASEASADAFDDIYLGGKAVAPTLDNDGNPIQDGALYFNTVNTALFAYDLGTTTWVQGATGLIDAPADGDAYVRKDNVWIVIPPSPGITDNAATTALTLDASLNATFAGLVDGRDIAADGTTLDGLSAYNITDNSDATFLSVDVNEAATFTSDVAVQGDSLSVYSATPRLILDELGGVATHSQTWMVQTANNLEFQTRNNAGTFLSTDYRGIKGVSGILEHRWSTNGITALTLNSAQNASFAGTVNGRDIAADGIILDGAAPIASPTFTGDVTVGNDNGPSTLFLDAGTADVANIYFRQNGVGGSRIAGNSSDALLLYSGGTSTAALTLDSSQNATFTGETKLQNGGRSLLIGADFVSSTLTDGIGKFAQIGFPHFTNAEEPISFALLTAGSTENTIAFGSGTNDFNAPTEITFATANNTTTLSTSATVCLTLAGGSMPTAVFTSDIVVTGTVDGRDVAADGTKLDSLGDQTVKLNTKVLDIGDWNMNTSVAGAYAVSINHGITSGKIRNVHVEIRNDDGSFQQNLEKTIGAIYGYITRGATQLTLGIAGGNHPSFDSSSYNSTSYNRGWVTIQYVD